MQLDISQKGKNLIIKLIGDFRHFDNPDLSQSILEKTDKYSNIVIDANKLTHWDSTTVSFVYEIMKSAQSIKFENIPHGLKKITQLALKVNRQPYINNDKKDFFTLLGDRIVEYWQTIFNILLFIKQIFLALFYFIKGKTFSRKEDWYDALANCGYKSVNIILLANFMTGLIFAFVGALQLKLFGAQIYIASIVTIAMVRIMGAIMTGIIMAGHYGAQIAAEIASMKVNGELDALKTFGLSAIDMVVLPRLVSLCITCPFLTIFADFAGIVGGLTVAIEMFDISALQYINYIAKAFSISDFIIGIAHGGIYGFIISVCGCYCGIEAQSDAKGVGDATTKSVVSAIVIMIVVTGILTWILEGLF